MLQRCADLSSEHLTEALQRSSLRISLRFSLKWENDEIGRLLVRKGGLEPPWPCDR